MRNAWAACLLFVAGWAGATPYDDGKEAFARQDWRAAASSLTRFLSENPDSSEAPAASFLRGVALYQQGDYRSSLDAFQKMERSWPQSPYALRLPYWKGTAALGAGQFALAERELSAQTQIAGQEPFTTRAWLNLALSRVSLERPAQAVEALAAFTRASAEPALLAQAWAVWGDLDQKANRLDEALGHYRASRSAHPGDQWDLWSRTQAVDILVGQQKFDEAKAELDQAQRAFPAEAGRWDSRRILVSRGLGDRPGLFRALEAQWAREPAEKKQELASNRAKAAEEAGQPEPVWWLRASQGASVAVGLPAILRYAFLLEGAQKPAEAALALETWAGTHAGALSAAEEVRHRAAQDRAVSGDRARAILGWEKLLSDFPTSARVPAWLLGRGRARLDGGDTVKALADFTRLLKDFPKAAEAPEARYQTGMVYLKRQEPARAESWFFGLVQDLGSGELYQRALLARGISFVNAGKTDLARSSLERLLREAPNGVWTGDLWSALGRNALQASLFEEAAAAFAQAEATQVTPQARAAALWSRAEALAARAATVEAASEAYGRFAVLEEPRAAEARYRQGAVFLPGKSWSRALEVWTSVVGGLKGNWLTQTREGMATALLRLGRAGEGWSQLEILEARSPSPEAWYRWGLAATTLGEGEWASKAFQYLLQNHPLSAVAEAALPRAAGALLSGGHPEEALQRYADYFQKFGRQPSSAPVARAAGAGALAFPALLEALVTASKTWNLAPEVSAEFSLAWAQSRLDSDSATAQKELEVLSQSAPWSSQRSEALLIWGKWHLAHKSLAQARSVLESAALLGDDVSVFKARWALAQVTEGEGDLTSSARQRESAEKLAGPGVPLEFRLQVLKEAADTWSRAGKGDDAERVRKRIAALSLQNP